MITYTDLKSFKEHSMLARVRKVKTRRRLLFGGIALVGMCFLTIGWHSGNGTRRRLPQDPDADCVEFVKRLDQIKEVLSINKKLKYNERSPEIQEKLKKLAEFVPSASVRFGSTEAHDFKVKRVVLDETFVSSSATAPLILKVEVESNTDEPAYHRVLYKEEDIICDAFTFDFIRRCGEVLKKKRRKV